LTLRGWYLFNVPARLFGSGTVSRGGKPARNQLAVRVECNPSPAIASAFGFLFRGAILFLRVNKRPNFVALDSLRAKIAKRFVLIFGAGTAKIAQQFHDRCAVHASHPGDGAQRIALNQSSYDRRSFFDAQFVHDCIMLDRSSIVNT
jgi:hypothetical protein